MARVRKSIKPHLEKYNSFVKKVQAREFTRKNIDVVGVVEEFITQAAKESYDKKLKITFNNSLDRSNNYYLKDEIQLSYNSRSYLDEKKMSFDWTTQLDDLQGYYNWNEYFKKEFRFVMDFENADEYAKEIFGKEYTASARKGYFSINPSPFSKNVNAQNEILLNEVVDFLRNEEIEFEIEVDNSKNPTISIDFKQFFNIEEIDKESKDETVEELNNKQAQILKEIEIKKKELEALTKQNVE